MESAKLRKLLNLLVKAGFELVEVKNGSHEAVIDGVSIQTPDNSFELKVKTTTPEDQ